MILNNDYDLFENFNPNGVNVECNIILCESFDDNNFLKRLKVIVKKVWNGIIFTLEQLITGIINIFTLGKLTLFPGPDFKKIFEMLKDGAEKYNMLFIGFQKYIPKNSALTKEQMEKQEQIIEKSKELNDIIFSKYENMDSLKSSPTINNNKSELEKAQALTQMVLSKSKKWASELYAYHPYYIHDLTCKKTMHNIQTLSSNYRKYINLYNYVIRRMIQCAKESVSHSLDDSDKKYVIDYDNMIWGSKYAVTK